MLAKGSAGKVFNAHGNAILFRLPEVALGTPMHQCMVTSVFCELF